MRASQFISCRKFPCTDVKHECHTAPDIEINPDKVSIALISEATPANPADYYYSGESALFQQTTVQAFQDAGLKVTSMEDILNLGVYFTTAVKCGKTGYGISSSTIEECSQLLEKELALFPKVKVYLWSRSHLVEIFWQPS